MEELKGIWTPEMAKKLEEAGVIKNLLDEKMIDALENPDNYMFSSFYPSPIYAIILEELEEEGVDFEDQDEMKKRVIHYVFPNKTEAWVLDDEKVLIQTYAEPIIIEGVKVEGWSGMKFRKPYREEQEK